MAIDIKYLLNDQPTKLGLEPYMSDFLQSFNKLTEVSKRFYTRLKLYCDKNGVCQGKTITELGFRECDYLKSVKELKNTGFIEIASRGKRKTNVYKILK